MRTPTTGPCPYDSLLCGSTLRFNYCFCLFSDFCRDITRSVNPAGGWRERETPASPHDAYITSALQDVSSAPVYKPFLSILVRSTKLDKLDDERESTRRRRGPRCSVGAVCRVRACSSFPRLARARSRKRGPSPSALAPVCASSLLLSPPRLVSAVYPSLSLFIHVHTHTHTHVCCYVSESSYLRALSSLLFLFLWILSGLIPCVRAALGVSLSTCTFSV